MNKLTFKNIIKKYFKRNKNFLLSNKILHEMNGVVLNRTNNQIYDFHSAMIEEVLAYCKNQGFEEINKIVFVSSYDTDIPHAPKINIKMEGESKIKIIKENNELIAVVCNCEYVNIKEIR